MFQQERTATNGSSNRISKHQASLQAATVARAAGLAVAYLRRGFALLLVAGLCLPAISHGAWYNASWQNRKAITLDGSQITGNLNNFPVLISLTDTDLGASALASGNDILFTDGDGSTKLDHEIERYVSASGTLVAWVRIPTLSTGTDKTIYIYYGNAGAANQQNVTGVWDAGYQGVWHLNENTADEANITNIHQDSTSNNNDADQNNGFDTNAKIYLGQDLDGANDNVDTNIASSGINTFTYSMWFRSDDAGAIGNDAVTQRLLTQRRAAAASRFAFGINNNRLAMYWFDGGDNIVEGSTTLSAATWYHAAVSYDGASIALYLNGNLQATGSESSMNAGSADTILLGEQTPGTREFDGIVDEARISTSARSADWTKTEFNNQNNPVIGGFIKLLGAQQSDSTAPASIIDLATGTITDNSVQLSWTAPGDDNSTGTASSYDIRYRTDAAITALNWDSATQVTGEPAPAVAGSGESFTITGLNSSTTFYFAIKTGDEIINWSGVSNSVSATTGIDIIAPTTIADLAATTVSDTGINLTWTAPGDDNSSGTAASYDIRYRTDAAISAANWGSATAVIGEPLPGIAGSGESFTVTGLTPNTTYYFAIRTLDEVPNWSGISNSPNATTSNTDVTPPAAITDLSTIGTPSSGSISLSWTSPGDDAGSGTATAYDLRYATTPITGVNWNTASQVTGEPAPQLAGNAEFLTVSGLAPATQYYFAIKTVDEIPNTSALSNIASNTTASAGSGTIQVLHPSDKTGSDSATYNGASAVTALDTNDGSTTYGYSGGSGTDYYLDIDDTSLAGDINSVTIKAYIAEDGFGGGGGGGGGISFRIGVDVNGTQSFSGTLTHSSTTYTLFSGTTMTTSPNTGQVWTWAEINSLIAILDHTDSDNMRMTEFWVEVDYNPADTTPPAQISDLATGSVTSTSIALSWTAPGDDGSTGTASAYDIRYATSVINAGNWASATQVTGEPAPAVAGSSETFTVTGLAANTTYYFAIIAIDEVPNYGSLSNVPNGTTAAAPPEMPTLYFQSATGATADESAANLGVTVVIAVPTGITGVDITVDITDGGSGSALSGTDYSAVGTATLTFPAGTLD
ncbi:MAG: DUF2341 domain-containing protein, partial [Nitrospira sp.]|nr:DUF2341 domain-containing protein [Nitrospira sp.]